MNGKRIIKINRGYSRTLVQIGVMKTDILGERFHVIDSEFVEKPTWWEARWCGVTAKDKLLDAVAVLKERQALLDRIETEANQ